MSLTALRGRVPVPPPLRTRGHTLTLGFVPGVPGHELMDAGRADAVLRACGETLRRIHAVPADFLRTTPDADTGTVLVHGDFGPHNLLLNPSTHQVTAVVDWEFAHRGDPVEDLARCAWFQKFCHRWEPDGPGVRLWEERFRTTAAWQEEPA
ncbi:phosphotransferase family protein [Streptomyces sp. NPDC096310]|uniref:phosphotransferase family protein n=1 Tax=Streptomyces sp. NPDC096310 TaxID=3366082 RepID=UPI003816AFC5